MRHVAIVSLLASSSCTLLSALEGNKDAGASAAEPDAGSASDAGAVDDADSRGDAGTVSDAGASGDAGSDSDGGAIGDAGAGSDACSAPDAGPAPLTVFTVVLENHDYAEVVGSADAPYLNSLIAKYALATNYFDSGSHPSLPNYLDLVSGATQYQSSGFIECDPTASPFPGAADDLGHQLTAAGIEWRSYQEGMGTPCALAAAGEYTPRHDPFLYFMDDRAACADTNVDASQLDADLAAGTYRFLWVTPNLVNGGHDPVTDPRAALRATDAWCNTDIDKLLRSPAFLANGVLFVTWSQAAGRNGHDPDQVPMIVATTAPPAVAIKSGVRHTHASYLETVEGLFGLPLLGDAATASDLSDLMPR